MLLANSALQDPSPALAFCCFVSRDATKLPGLCVCVCTGECWWNWKGISSLSYKSFLYQSAYFSRFRFQNIHVSQQCIGCREELTSWRQHPCKLAKLFILVLFLACGSAMLLIAHPLMNRLHLQSCNFHGWRKNISELVSIRLRNEGILDCWRNERFLLFRTRIKCYALAAEKPFCSLFIYYLFIHFTFKQHHLVALPVDQFPAVK